MTSTSPCSLMAVARVALVASFNNVVYIAALAAYVFSGSLSGHLPAGIGMGLVSGMVVSGVVALTSGHRGMLALPKDGVAPILAIMAVSLMTDIPAGASPEEVFLTVGVGLALASLLAGLIFLGLGLLKLGVLIRYFPYPVVGGISAGAGYYLVKGSFVVSLDVPANSLAGAFSDPGRALAMLFGTAFGFILFLARSRFRHPLVLPGFLLAGLLLAWILPGSDQVPGVGSGPGSLLEPGIIPLLELTGIRGLDPSIFWHQMPMLGTAILKGLLSLLLAVAGLEVMLEKDLDLNRELRSAGLANILAALAGGSMVCAQDSEATILAKEHGAQSRLTGLLLALFMGLVLVFGQDTLPPIPRTVLGGFLFYLGAEILWHRLYETGRRMPWHDYCVVLLILVVCAVVGFVEGVVIGMIAAMVIFAVNASRTGVVRNTLDGTAIRSNVDRAPREDHVLRRDGRAIRVFKLQGYLFFGTAHLLIRRVREMTDDDPGIRYVILDFSRVVGMDSSAVQDMVRLRPVVQHRSAMVVFAGVNRVIGQQMAAEKLSQSFGQMLVETRDLDHALEVCEDLVLAQARLGPEQSRLEEFLQDELSVEQARVFAEYTERLEMDSGTRIIQEGEASDDLYFLESGRLTVQMEVHGRPVRLRTLGPGTVVGEIGLYTGAPRTASVVTDQSSVLFRLRAKDLRRLEEAAPETAAAFHRFMARLLGQRLADTNRLVRALEA